MKLILTRHGETEENVKGILQGHLPGKLTKKGIEQAKKLGLRLKDEKIDVIYSSDLKRAADTAKEIAKYHKNIPVFFVKELRETDHGAWTGKSETEVDWNNKPEDMETWDDKEKRVKRILEEAYEKYPSKTVLFVGHGGINKAIFKFILKEGATERDAEFWPAASVSVFEIRKDRNHKIHLFCCTRHLD